MQDKARKDVMGVVIADKRLCILFQHKDQSNTNYLTVFKAHMMVIKLNGGAVGRRSGLYHAELK